MLDYPSFKNLVMKENKCHLSRQQQYRVKKMARHIANGSEMDQYNKWPRYINEINRRYRVHTVIMKMVNDCHDVVTKQE